jgi:mannose-6-phosphate isomerase-like protein (cupin superfamily)
VVTGAGVQARIGPPTEPEQPSIKPAAVKLGQEIHRQIDDGEPVLKFAGNLIAMVAHEEEGPVCILGTNLRAEKPYQAIDPNLFLGVTSDANLSESSLNEDPLANSHLHWQGTEVYIVREGRMLLHAWRGRNRFTYEAVAGDILRVGIAVPHKVVIDPNLPTLVYVVRSPAAVRDYKQEWPAKTKP